MSLSAHDELLLLRKRARRRLVGAVFLVLAATGVLWNVVGTLPEREMKPESVEISGFPAASAPVAQASAPHAVMASQPVASAPETDILATLPPEDSVIPPPLPVAPAKQAPASTPVAVPVPKAVAPAIVDTKPLPKAPEPKPEPKVAPVKPAEPKVVTPKVIAEKKPEKKVEEPAAVKLPKQDPAAILEGRDFGDASPKKTEAHAEKFQVQLAALSDPDKISSLKQRLAGAGVNAHFSTLQTSKGEVTRVRVGPFGTRAEADAALRKLERAGVPGIIVTK